jgi:hypothetical protein
LEQGRKGKKIMEIKGLQKRWASEGYTEQTAQTFQEIKAIIDEVAAQFSLDEVTRKIASISASAFCNVIEKDSPQRGKISVFTCLNLSQYSGIPFEVFCGRQPFTELHKEKFRNALMRDFNPISEEKEKKSLTDICLNHKILSKKSELNIKELLDYFADILAAKIYEKIQGDKNSTDLLNDIKNTLRDLNEKE